MFSLENLRGRVARSAKQVIHRLSAVLPWLKRFNEPLTLVTLLLFFATLALYLATRDLVIDSKDTARQQLRAYVGVVDHEIKVSVGASGHVQVRIKNFGQTPAFNVRYWMNEGPFDYPLKQALPEKAFQPGTIVLFPTDVFSPTLTITPLDNALQDALRRESKRLYVYGRIVYDSFGTSYTTDFRLYYAAGLIQQGRMAWAEDGNSADQNSR
jgi:hypothetical protein